MTISKQCSLAVLGVAKRGNLAIETILQAILQAGGDGCGETSLNSIFQGSGV